MALTCGPDVSERERGKKRNARAAGGLLLGRACEDDAGLDWAGLAEVALSFFFLKTFLIFYFLFLEIHITFEIIVQIGSNQFE